MTEYADLKAHIEQALYNYYIINSTATFHIKTLTADSFTEMSIKPDGPYESFAVIHDGVFGGYAYYSAYSMREAYRRTAEAVIYLKPSFHGMGIGSGALEQLETRAFSNGIRVMIARVTDGNLPSINLFVRHGYECCGLMRNVGEKAGKLLSVRIYLKEL